MVDRPQFIELPSPNGLDIVSDLKLYQENLIVSSWDNRILIYDCCNLKTLTSEIRTPITPLSLYTNNRNTYVGLLDGSIRAIDLENAKLSPENISDIDLDYKNGINNICGIDDQPSCIIASSISGKLQIVDSRARKSILINLGRNKKIFTMDSNKNYLTVGLSGNFIELYDIRNISLPFETRELGLKYQIVQLKCYPNQQGFALSTIDGRVSMEYFDSSPEVQMAKRFTFKCHRFQDKSSMADTVYPVNSISFNKQYGTLFTAGSDGTICLWDTEMRKRMKMLPKFDMAVVKIDTTDNLLAVATSDDSFTRLSKIEYQKPSKSSKIYIRQLHESDYVPKRLR